MRSDINVAEIEAYNKKLKMYNEKSASLKAEIKYANDEIESLCKELSEELGFQVTPDNIQRVYDEQVAKIQSTLNSGKIILSKIEEGEGDVNVDAYVQRPVGVVQNPSDYMGQTAQAATPTQGTTIQAATPTQEQTMGMSGQTVVQPQSGQVFTGQAAQQPAMNQGVFQNNVKDDFMNPYQGAANMGDGLRSSFYGDNIFAQSAGAVGNAKVFSMPE